MADTQKAVEFLLEVMKSDAYALAIRTAAAEGLGYAGGQKVREQLIKVVTSSAYATDLRAAAAKALGHAAKE